jgi:hypothetical protein
MYSEYNQKIHWMCSSGRGYRVGNCICHRHNGTPRARSADGSFRDSYLGSKYSKWKQQLMIHNYLTRHPRDNNIANIDTILRLYSIFVICLQEPPNRPLEPDESRPHPHFHSPRQWSPCMKISEQNFIA